MIISGYQGIGKSTLALNNPGYIDLESSNFFVDGVRASDWYKVYTNVAKDLSDHGFRVFVSSHKLVRMWMDFIGIKFIAISPNIVLEDEWIDKLKKRYEQTGSEKDYKALRSTEDHFREDVTDMQNERYHLIINGMIYDLEKLIDATYGDQSWCLVNQPDFLNFE